MPIELVLVDFDDTLVDTAPRFQRGRVQLFDLLEAQGFSRADIERVHHDDVDREMIRRHGFGPYRLEPSFRETYLELCRLTGRQPELQVVAACAACALEVAGTPPCLDGALDALRTLAARLPTVVYTQSGDSEYQLRCIEESGVLEVVTPERVHIAPHKTADEFRATLRRFGAAPAASWMVGNSMRSDVNPALESGANAILVEAAEPWHYDVVDPVHEEFVRVPSFADAVRYLLKLQDEDEREREAPPEPQPEPEPESN